MIGIEEQGALERLYRQADKLDSGDRDLAIQGLIPAVLGRCAEDGFFWLRFVQTRDEADPTHSMKPFPVHLDYLRLLWRALTDSHCVAIAKSRKMLVSWAVAAFCAWVARFTPNQAIYWQSQQHSDAVKMVSMPSGGYMGRCQFIEETLEPWMRVKAKFSEGRIQYPNGSIIEAVAGGADKVRGQVLSVYVGDEFAYQEDQAGVWATVAPMLEKGARAIFISTPNGSDNMFCTLYHGRSMTTREGYGSL